LIQKSSNGSREFYKKIAAYLSIWDRIHKRLFSIFDLMRTAEDLIRCPVPWALTGETSFVARE